MRHSTATVRAPLGIKAIHCDIGQSFDGMTPSIRDLQAVTDIRFEVALYLCLWTATKDATNDNEEIKDAILDPHLST